MKKKNKINEEYEGERVKIITNDGETYIGKVMSVEQASDNDRNEMAIDIWDDKKLGTGFYESDIESIELI